MERVNPTLESFNVFLGEKLSAAAHEIFRFVERTVTDYQLEVERTKQENQRLQRLVDLIYKPDIRLRRSDSGHICLPTSTLEKQIQTDCIIKEEPCDPDPPAEEVTVAEDEEDQVGGAQNEALRCPTQVITNKEQTPSHKRYKKKKKVIETRSQSFRENNCHKSLVCKERKTKGVRHLKEDKQIECPTCGKMFKTKHKMKAHVESHMAKRPYGCYICGKLFDRSSNLRKHVAVVHKRKEPFRCSQCKTHFIRWCGSETDGQNNLQDAREPVAPPSTGEFRPSPGANLDEPGPSDVKEERGEEEEMWINGGEEPFSAEDTDDDDSLTKELIKTVQQLEDCRAAEESQEQPAGTGQDRDPDPDTEPPEEPPSTTLYRCHVCNYIFTKKSVLTWHLKTHESKTSAGKVNFDCHVCGKHIPCQSNLQNHMRVHTGERPYSCHYCSKSFKLKGHMTEHIRTHTGEKPFGCHMCGKSFNRGSTLRKHVLAKHKEERPYKCDDCDELFTERLLMKTHMRKVHGVKMCSGQSSS